MGRPARIWWRAERGQWFATISGKKTALGSDRANAEQQFHRLKSREVSVDQSTIKVWVLVERYLARVEKEIKPPTFRNYRFVLADWARRYGSMSASEIRPYHVDDWIDEHPTWNKSTRALHIHIVKIWSVWCARKGYQDVERLHLMRAGAALKRKHAPRASLAAALAAIRSPQFRDFFVVLWETGARPIEICRLTASAIDWKACTAIVQGKRGERAIGLTKAAMAILKRNARRWPEGAIFRNSWGNAWNTSACDRHFQSVRKRIGQPDLVLYHCRHDFYGRAAKAGKGDALTSAQLGHTPRQLSSTYAHPDDSELVSLAEASSIFAPAPTRRRQPARAGSPTTHAPRKRGKSVGRARR